MLPNWEYDTVAVAGRQAPKMGALGSALIVFTEDVGSSRSSSVLEVNACIIYILRIAKVGATGGAVNGSPD